jgi:hypothetical protein
MQCECQFVPSAVVDCLCLFPKTEAAMALGWVAAAFAGRKNSCVEGASRLWGVGREMERGTAATPRKGWETRQVRDSAIEEVRRTRGASSARQQRTGFSIAGPEKYPCQNPSRLISLEHMQGWRHMFCLLSKRASNATSSSAPHNCNAPDHPPRVSTRNSRNTVTLSR